MLPYNSASWEPVPVGILINNAGFGDCGSFLETDADKEMQMIDVNVKSHASFDETDASPHGKAGGAVTF